MSAGRIETYVHSDKSTANKGGVMIKVTCKTDFAAKTDEFINFCKRIAKLSYGYIREDSEISIDDFPDLDENTCEWWAFLVDAVGFTDGVNTLEDERLALSKVLGEEIVVEAIIVIEL